MTAFPGDTAAAIVGTNRGAGRLLDVPRVAERTHLIDLRYLGRPEVIASGLLESSAGALLVDPGPSVSLSALRAGLEALGVGVADLRAILLTHIHFDHAGAVGSLVRDNPSIRVYVHERGARHLIDPSRLLESARRLYRENMDRLWGEFLPVPASNVTALAGGETLALGDRPLEVAYTPGHASHHVSYLDRATGTGFVGDTGGNRYSNRAYVSPVTPPPDVDLEGWRGSIARFRAWSPERLFSAHFGCSHPVGPHLDELEARLAHWADQVRGTLPDPDRTDDQKAAAFVAWVAAQIRERLSDADAQAYEWGTTALNSWHGLARYWRERLGPTGHP